MLEKEEDIPEGAFRPKRDKGIHLAQCQAFAMSRRDGITVAMLKMGDFPRPDFYKELFRKWGLDTEE